MPYCLWNGNNVFFFVHFYNCQQTVAHWCSLVMHKMSNESDNWVIEGIYTWIIWINLKEYILNTGNFYLYVMHHMISPIWQAGCLRHHNTEAE